MRHIRQAGTALKRTKKYQSTDFQRKFLDSAALPLCPEQVTLSGVGDFSKAMSRKKFHFALQ
jgi:hypothetical protein